MWIKWVNKLLSKTLQNFKKTHTMESFISKDIGLQPAASTINDSITYHYFPVNFTKLLSQLFCRMVAASGMTLFKAIELLMAFIFQNQYSFL